MSPANPGPRQIKSFAYAVFLLRHAAELVKRLELSYFEESVEKSLREYPENAPPEKRIHAQISSIADIFKENDASFGIQSKPNDMSKFEYEILYNQLQDCKESGVQPPSIKRTKKTLERIRIKRFQRSFVQISRRDIRQHLKTSCLLCIQ